MQVGLIKVKEFLKNLPTSCSRADDSFYVVILFAHLIWMEVLIDTYYYGFGTNKKSLDTVECFSKNVGKELYNLYMCVIVSERNDN